MAVVLGEGAHAHDAMQRPRRLVAVAGTELGEPDGQVAITLQPLAEDLHMARAVHRLDAEFALALVDDDLEHVVAIDVPVA
jgi:hypothetical protein